MARVPPTQNTVYGRMKKTGYLMGPEHRMAPDDFVAPSTDAATKGGAPDEESKAPPNFRDSANEDESCGDCDHLEGERCQQYDYPTTVNMVCDSFTEKGGEDEEDETGLAAQQSAKEGL